ncbi:MULTISPECIES: hypothetical protein [Flavobacterium]|uniref:hypothetical protein n=1 Tax=Flavobacterium TaxID=237 RepID=UPI002113EB51|nr:MULTISPECIES: hypothetical protein [Flavobacterium]UUF13758.1 hypothetical protein NLJ00_21090 [Flavobacterium panici]
MENEPKEKIDIENFRMYYQLQYDRIDHLETRRENFSNFILTISSGVFILTLTNAKDFNNILSLGLFLFMSFINLIAIAFFNSTMPFITMHQERAKAARIKYDKILSALNESIKKPEPQIKIKKWKISCKRHNIYKLLHYVIIIFFGALALYLIFFHNVSGDPLLNSKNGKI